MEDRHHGEDFSKIQWGMLIVKYLRTAFIRQIEEAVLIAKESENNELLNSRSEWSQASLPRLTTRVRDLEEEVKKWEADLKKENKLGQECHSRNLSLVRLWIRTKFMGLENL